MKYNKYIVIIILLVLSNIRCFKDKKNEEIIINLDEIEITYKNTQFLIYPEIKDKIRLYVKEYTNEPDTNYCYFKCVKKIDKLLNRKSKYFKIDIGKIINRNLYEEIISGSIMFYSHMIGEVQEIESINETMVCKFRFKFKNKIRVVILYPEEKLPKYLKSTLEKVINEYHKTIKKN